MFQTCPICVTPFDLSDFRPKMLPCQTHCMCRSCALRLGETGQITCPYGCGTAPFNSINQLKEPQIVLQLIADSLITCAEHSRSAVKFCFRHTLALCATCAHTDPACTPKDIDGSTQFDIKKHLIGRFEDWIVHSKELFEDLPEQYQGAVAMMKEWPIALLMSFHTYLQRKEKYGVCMECRSQENRYVDVDTMKTYCSRCFITLSHRDLSVSQTFTEIPDHESNIRQTVVSAVKEHLKKVDFRVVTVEQCEWLRTQPDSFYRFLTVARHIVGLPTGASPGEVLFPDPVVCPTGHHLRFRCSLYRLPCSAFHAICEDCAVGMFNSLHLLSCPLDGQNFNVTLSMLEKLEWRRLFHPSVRSRVAENHPLANVGRLIPQFSPMRNIIAPIPVERMTAVDRFLRVLPDDNSVVLLDDGDSGVFRKPWVISMERNQVEALTFSAHRDITLWGIGFASVVPTNTCARIEWVKIYPGARASGPARPQPILINSDFKGKEGVVINDTYFSSPVRLPASQQATVKLKVSPRSTPQGRSLSVYHGNHIGRYVDVTGLDGTQFDFYKTEAVDNGEWFSRQQEIVGPILRLIYEAQ